MAGGGGVAALTTLIPAKIHADNLARNSAARTMGADLAETEALAHARRQLPESADGAPAVAGEATGVTAEQVILQRADLEIAEAAQRVKPMPDTLDVVVHGEVDHFIVFDEGLVPKVISHRSLAKYIERSGKSYKRIRLIACKTGLHPHGAAQHLANKLHAKLIEAPTDKVHIHGDGSMTIGPSDTVNSGHWEPFTPKPSRFRYTEYRAPKVTETRYERFRRERAEKAAAQANEASAPPEGASEIPSMDISRGEAKSMGRRPRPRDAADSLFDEREPGSSVVDEASELRHGDDPADHVPDSSDAGELGLSRDGERRVRHVAKSEAPSSVAQEAGAGVLSSNRLGITRPPRHHVLPQAEIEFFQERGFPGRAIDDFTIEMPTPLHEEVHGVNQSLARRHWPEREWNTEVMSRLREAEALKKVQLRRQLRAHKKPTAEIDQILATDGKLTPDEIWSVVNQVMVKFKIDGLPFVKYDAPASIPVEAPTAGNQP